MPTAIDSSHEATARASKRFARSVTGLTSVASTGIVTFAAGFLDELAPGDEIVVSSPTGTHLPAGTYYLIGPTWAAGATTAKVSATPNGAPVTTGTNLTAGTATSGRLTSADGVVSGNYVSQQSPRGR